MSSDKENEEDYALPDTEVGELGSGEDNDTFIELEEDVLQLLGDVGTGAVEEFKFHPELVKQWKKVLSEGLSKEVKSEMLDQYPRKGNCPISTPKLNPEIEAIVNDSIKRRDKYLAADQEICGAGLSSLGEAINMIFNSDNDGIAKNDLLKLLLDSGKLMCDLFAQLTKARKAFIYPGLDKKAKTLLGNATTGEFLFGPELSQRIKTASTVEKIGLTLKPQPPGKKTPFRANSLNWKRPPVKATQQFQAGYKRQVQYPRYSRTFRQSGSHKDNRQAQNRQASLPKAPTT